MTFTVVIPTFNREHLVLRTIRSVYQTNWPELEIIVVDDASTDGTSAAIIREFPQVRYLRLEQNSGPGVARNTGIRRASSAWIVLMDDDDLLQPDSLTALADHIAGWPTAENYPCLQFSRSNGELDQPFRLVHLQDYLQGRISGDFVPVINCVQFRKAGLSYPNLRIGGEHLLWFHIAKHYGIPTWRRCVAVLGPGRRVKLCSTASQLARPKEYAELARRTLDLFGEDIWNTSPQRYLKYALSATIYYLLAGDIQVAGAAAQPLKRRARTAILALITIAGLVPRPLLRLLFRAYRYPLEHTGWKVNDDQGPLETGIAESL